VKVHRFTWRKLVSAKWEDEWWERLRAFSGRLASTALPGASTVRIEAFALTKSEAQRLSTAFGGSVRTQKPVASASVPPRAPLRVRGRLAIVANAADCARAGKAPVLVIPAGMAFGTGDHATTAACLRLLADLAETLVAGKWEMLDLGCGTGILALAARALGARRAEAVDFDPDAVRTARENARLNSMQNVAVKKLDVRAWRPRRTWKVVAANLFSGLLVETAPAIAAAVARDGRLILSGVLCIQEETVLAAFARRGLRPGRIVRRGKWIAAVLQRGR
jgi:ribosomal protein L11 methyltransferase